MTSAYVLRADHAERGSVSNVLRGPGSKRRQAQLSDIVGGITLAEICRNRNASIFSGVSAASFFLDEAVLMR